MATSLDSQTTALARQIAELGAGERSTVFRMSFWSERLLDWAMAKPAFKTQLFRFTDVFPATTDDRDVMRHIDEYFDGEEVPKVLHLGIDVAEHVPLGRTIAARVARRNIMRMAQQFIVGESAGHAVEGLHRLWQSGSAFTVDLLGEKTIIEAEADRYAARVDEMLRTLTDAARQWAPDERLERDDLGPLPRVNLSVKPTALATHYASLSREEGVRSAAERLRPLLRLARDLGCHVHFDMEHYDAKDLTLALFRQLVGEDEFADLHAGIVIQAYLKDSRDDLADVIAWASSRLVPITVRLVKGAYWDTETVESRAQGWPSPVYEHKGETDANYERCVRLLHDHHGQVRAAFGSHNLRSLAYAIAYGRSKGIPDNGYELQMLYGMAEPMHAAVKRMGMRLRVYSPVGELVPGMAYLVRRLLENTSNESFVRHRFAEGRGLDELIAPPSTARIPGPTAAVRVPPTEADRPSPYEPEPPAEWRRATTRAAFSVAVDRAPMAFPIDVPAVIDGERFTTANAITSVDPGHTDTVVATSASCTAEDADRAIAVAVREAERWRHTPARERAAVLFRTAEWFRARRPEMAALQVYEAGKPWDQADADVCEAIDFCEYYGREVLRLDAGGTVQSPPGEANTMRYYGKGVGVVIAPWNFPLAIPCGMTIAGLAAGNPVILKPAEQTPAIASKIVEALTDSGLPQGVIGFLPGIGEDVGARLVEHPDVAFIIFTGSKAVGLAINQKAAVPVDGQRGVKRVVAEMGGKNALVVDADADPDQAVPAAVYSAFGFAGQKCSAASRLVVHEAVYDQVVDRLVGATRELLIGHPRHMSTQMGPVIDADAYKRINSWIERAPEMGTLAFTADDLPEGGYYVGPTIVTDVTNDAAIAREEIFGPVLCVLRAASFEDAVRIANDTDYALTAGVFSRSPANIRHAADHLRGGNVYVNRSTTGAVVGRQPFGGYALSGVGSKAGGPDYLLQFMDPRVVTENTLRQGFAPDLPS